MDRLDDLEHQQQREGQRGKEHVHGVHRKRQHGVRLATATGLEARRPQQAESEGQADALTEGVLLGLQARADDGVQHGGAVGEDRDAGDEHRCREHAGDGVAPLAGRVEGERVEEHPRTAETAEQRGEHDAHDADDHGPVGDLGKDE